MTLKKHEPFDETTKAFYDRLFKNWGFKVETEREIFSRARKIDLVVTSRTEATQARLKNTVFAHFRQLNAIELKGFYDPLTIADFNRIMMRAWGMGVKKSPTKLAEESDDLMEAEEESTDETPQLAHEMTVTIVCVTRPDKILNQLSKEYRFVKKEAGIYLSDEKLSQWIIHPTELDLVEKNYPLLPLARGKKLEQFIALCLKEGLKDYLQLIVDIGLATDPELIWQKLLEAKPMKHIIREETWPIIDQFFQEMPEAIGKLPTFQDALSQSLRQGFQDGFQDGEQQGEQRVLIRQLRHKFNRVPKGIVQQIEATTDLEQLDDWLVQVISAKKLAEIDFNLPQKVS
ncbi:MAG: hypothetical protein DRQ49_14425 [Gammaproteobacteria bacterium]|nr:MAG: hypothetical protein DRQ49_14425 [Gammaproteobacteria bacterium]RKZ45481.1 MAG: hypothetical protein DRQ41_00145 [Gammaproteobacteria bacterium]RKZ74986.1 MAG: hypothetical protein DRQ57_09050 [Gammaproteobacteria bacterium]